MNFSIISNSFKGHWHSEFLTKNSLNFNFVDNSKTRIKSDDSHHNIDNFRTSPDNSSLNKPISLRIAGPIYNLTSNSVVNKHGN